MRAAPGLRLAPYADAFGLGLQEALAYPSQIWTRLVIIPMAVFFQVAVYNALFEASPGRMGGMTLDEVIGYVALVQVLRTLYANNISIFIGNAVRTGAVATYLLRPMSFPAFALSLTGGRGASQVLTVGVPTLLAFAALGALPAPASGVHLAGFLVLSLQAFVLYNLVFSLTGMLGFYIDFSGEIGWSVELLMMLLGGATVPLTFFPQWFQSAASWMPFRAIYFTPVEAWLGRIPPAALLGHVGVSALWTAALALALVVAYRRGRRHLTIQGG